MKIFKTIPLENKFFEEELIENENESTETECGVINVFEEFKYQEIVGFGGAFTESVAYNYSLQSNLGKAATILPRMSETLLKNIWLPLLVRKVFPMLKSSFGITIKNAFTTELKRFSPPKQ